MKNDRLSVALVVTLAAACMAADIAQPMDGEDFDPGTQTIACSGDAGFISSGLVVKARRESDNVVESSANCTITGSQAPESPARTGSYEVMAFAGATFIAKAPIEVVRR